MAISADVENVPAHQVPSRWHAHVNGESIDSVLTASVTMNGSNGSSRFDMTVGTGLGGPDNRWWSGLSGRVLVDIFTRSQPTGYNALIFSGVADGIALDPIGKLAHIHGRDYSSFLVGTSYSDSFCNKTASEIAYDIAVRHGFPSKIEPTSDMVGRYQKNDYSQILLNAHSRNRNDWETLAFLARRHGMEFFVDGKTLVFASLDSLVRRRVSISCGNVLGIRFHRRCPISDQAKLTVKSWNAWLNRSFASSEDIYASSLDPFSSEPGGTPSIDLAFLKPNLGSSEVDLLTRRYRNEIAKNKMTVDIEVREDLSLKVYDTLTICDSGTDFDAEYVIRSVRSCFSSRTGSVQHITGLLNSTAFTSSVGGPV